jgi:hypothetical protein
MATPYEEWRGPSVPCTTGLTVPQVAERGCRLASLPEHVGREALTKPADILTRLRRNPHRSKLIHEVVDEILQLKAAAAAAQQAADRWQARAERAERKLRRYEHKAPRSPLLLDRLIRSLAPMDANTGWLDAGLGCPFALRHKGQRKNSGADAGRNRECGNRYYKSDPRLGPRNLRITKSLRKMAAHGSLRAS